MMTKAFCNNGASRVYIIGRRKEKLDEAAKLAPGVVIPIVGDVTSKESLCAAAKQVREDVGFVNLLCCNSGSMPPPVGLDPTKVSLHEYQKHFLAEQKVEDWNNGFASNAVSVPFSTMAFLDLLDAGNKKGNCPGRRSQVIVTSSIAGYLRVPKNFGCYPASKAATSHLIKHLSGTLSPYGVRVNGIAPGLFPSELAAGLIAQGGDTGKDPTDEGAYGTDFIPAQRLGKTDDMVGTMLYMASAAGAYLNGNIQVIDGGRVGILNGTY